MNKNQVKVNRLKSLRGLYEINQAELARYLGINTNRYSKCESRLADFKLTEMLKIVQFFRQFNETISLNDIWGE